MLLKYLVRILYGKLLKSNIRNISHCIATHLLVLVSQITSQILPCKQGTPWHSILQTAHWPFCPQIHSSYLWPAKQMKAVTRT